MKLTESQISIVRHAIGLNASNKTFRNRYIAGDKHASIKDLDFLVENGFSEKFDGKDLMFGGSHFFSITRRGAEAVLLEGEEICDEEFPPMTKGS